MSPFVSERGSHIPAGPADPSDHVGRSATEPVGPSIHEQGSYTSPSHISPFGPVGPATGRGHRHNGDAPTEITLDGCQYRRIVIPGDGNCLFRSVCELHPDLSQDDHLDLRTHDWCRRKRERTGITADELHAVHTPGHSTGDRALVGLCNVLDMPVAVVYDMHTSRERQIFRPAESPSGTLNETICLYFHLNGHYDVLKPVAIPRPFLSDQNWHRHNAFLRDLDQRASRHL